MWEREASQVMLQVVPFLETAVVALQGSTMVLNCSCGCNWDCFALSQKIFMLQKNRVDSITTVIAVQLHATPIVGLDRYLKPQGHVFASYLSISSFFHEELIMAAILVMEIVLEQVSWNVIHCQWFRPFVLPIIHYQSLRNRWLNCVMRFFPITNFRNFSHIS